MNIYKYNTNVEYKLIATSQKLRIKKITPITCLKTKIKHELSPNNDHKSFTKQQ